MLTTQNQMLIGVFPAKANEGHAKSRKVILSET